MNLPAKCGLIVMKLYNYKSFCTDIQYSNLSSLLVKGIMKKIFEKLFLRYLKSDQFCSVRLRKYFQSKYNIEIGMYSYGCFCPVRIAQGTKIGRYCSLADTVRILNGNHGLNYLTLHPYTYNTSLGVVNTETITRSQCVVADDVWIGHNAIILPNVRSIGRGAVIAAGAVVTKDVLPYSIIGGNPAKLIRMRFTEEIIEKIEYSQWWKWDKEKMAQHIKNTPELIYSPETFFSKK